MYAEEKIEKRSFKSNEYLFTMEETEKKPK